MLTVNFHPFPEIETDRLILRRPVVTDVEEVFFLRSDKGVMQFIDKEPCQSIDEAKEHIEKLQQMWLENEGIAWAITLNGEARMIGSIGIWRIERENYRAEIGYALNTAYHRQGIMQEAIAPVLSYAFETMKLHSLEAQVNPANQGSVRLLEKNGFLREGYFKENYHFKGRFLDTAVYSLLAKNKL